LCSNARRNNAGKFAVLVLLLAIGCKRPSRATPAGNALSGAFHFGPTAVVRRDGRIDLFVVGSNRTVWRSPCDELPCDRRTRYGDWLREAGAPPGGVGSRVSVTAWSQGRYDLFALGARDKHIWHQTRSGTRWLGWEDLGPEFFTAPAAVSWGDGRMDVFAGGPGETIKQRYCQSTGPLACRGAGMYPWVAIPGRPPQGFTGDPVAVSPAPDQIDIAVLGRDGAIWYVGWQGGWGGWQSLGGQFTSQPALAAVGGRTEIYALDAQGKLWRTSGANRTFEPFHVIDASLPEAPTAAGSQNRVELFARTKDNGTIAHLSCEGDHCLAR
jgi:hypothetical protein